MPPKSAAELALQQKYEQLRKRKEAGAKKQEAAQPSLSKEDAARAAAVKALQARRAAEEKAAAAAATAAAAPSKPAAGSQSPGALKLKFVIPKKEEPAPAQPPAQRSRPSTGSAAIAGGRKEPPPAAGRSKPQAERPAAAVAGPPLGAGSVKAPEGQEAAGLKRPTAARRPTARRPPLQQQQEQQEHLGPDDGGASRPAEGMPGGAEVEHGRAGREDYYGEGRGYGGGEESHERGGYGAGEYGGGRYDERGYEDEGYGRGERGSRYEEEEDEEGPYAKRRRGEEQTGGSGREKENCTLFVGDLPPFWASRDLETFFSQFGMVRQARVMGSQCYGFVTYASRQEAEALLESTQQQPLAVEGHGLVRINWSQGSMPDWKKGPAVVRPRQPGEGPHELESYEHPRVREARLAAQAMLSQQDLSYLAGPPPSRHMVSYDDL